MSQPVHPGGRAEVFGRLEFHDSDGADGVRPRRVAVWLPPSYDPAYPRPVLYMHDGHNCFEPAASYDGADWQLDEVITELEAAGRITAPIVVAPYTDEHRIEEYWIGPTGEAYREWVTDELKPLIDSRYSTLPGRAATAVMGSSMGGLSSFLLAHSRSDVFGAAGCMSPAFSLTLHLAHEVADGDWPTDPLKLYVDNGGDRLDTELQPAIDDMLAALDACRFGERGTLEWYRDEGAPHHESAWSQRVWRPLELFFAPPA